MEEPESYARLTESRNMNIRCWRRYFHEADDRAKVQ